MDWKHNGKNTTSSTDNWLMVKRIGKHQRNIFHAFFSFPKWRVARDRAQHHSFMKSLISIILFLPQQPPAAMGSWIRVNRASTAAVRAQQRVVCACHDPGWWKGHAFSMSIFSSMIFVRSGHGSYKLGLLGDQASKLNQSPPYSNGLEVPDCPVFPYFLGHFPFPFVPWNPINDHYCQMLQILKGFTEY